MSETICTVMVGLPGLGKSTLIEAIHKSDTWIYSTDMYIESVAEDNGITYSEAFESNIKAATDFNERKLKTMMDLRKDIIWDQTNLGVSKRRKIINCMKQAGYSVRCTCIVPPETALMKQQWLERIENRPGKIIPQHVLANMVENYVEPTLEEGFGMISYYNMYGALLGVDYE